MIKMGKVRTEQVKRIARELVDKYPDKFTADFEKNKLLVKDYTNISSTKLRNRVAGYTARLASTMYGSEDSEPDDED
jgi:small subunit ribosomal protein S17e